MLVTTSRRGEAPTPEPTTSTSTGAPEFAAQHSLAFPELSNAGVSAGLGPLGREYVLAAGGAGYFRLDVVRRHLESGRLHRVEGGAGVPVPGLRRLLGKRRCQFAGPGAGRAAASGQGARRRRSSSQGRPARAAADAAASDCEGSMTECAQADLAYSCCTRSLPCPHHALFALDALTTVPAMVNGTAMHKLVVMGVAGSGKSTLAEAIAARDRRAADRGRCPPPAEQPRQDAPGNRVAGQRPRALARRSRRHCFRQPGR